MVETDAFLNVDTDDGGTVAVSVLPDDSAGDIIEM